MKNSRIVHATAKTMGGAFTFTDEALPVWAHNAAPVRAPKTHTACPGCYYLFHIGPGHYTSPPEQCGPDGKQPRLADEASAISACEFVAHGHTIGPHSEQEKKVEFSCTSALLCPKEAAAACAAHRENCSSFGVRVDPPLIGP